MEKYIQQKKGITLIALVITVIVLLILAGISISMLSGDNSILQKATDAKTNTEKQNIIELAKTDILGQIADNKGENISTQQLKTVLKTYFNENEVEALDIPNDVSTSNYELTTKKGEYKIRLSEIYSGKIISDNKKLDYYIGDIVTISDQQFYVIEDSPASETLLKLITAQNIETNSSSPNYNKQSATASKVAFSEDTVIYSHSDVKRYIDRYITSLGKTIEESGLIGFTEISALGGNLENFTTNECPSFINETSYWTGYVSGKGVYCVNGEQKKIIKIGCDDNTLGGVRPVLTILKSNI